MSYPKVMLGTLDPLCIGHRPDEAVVKDVTLRYVLQSWACGYWPSPEWRAEHPQYPTRKEAVLFCINRNIGFDTKQGSKWNV